MASGVLGSASLAAATNTTIYTVPAGKIATININACNTSSTISSFIRIAISASANPSLNEWIEYDAFLGFSGSEVNNNVLERTALVVDAGKQVVAYSDNAGVVVMTYGLEQ